MPLLTRDLLSRVGFLARHRKKILPGIITIAAGAILGISGFLVWKYQTKVQTPSAVLAYELPKAWLLKYFASDDEYAPGIGGPDGDPDGDVFSNRMEYLYGTDPTREDTDGDGELDSFEVAFGRNPNGDGDLALTTPVRDYIAEVLASDEKFSDFKEENILAETEQLLQPDRAVLLDLPEDRELVFARQDDTAAIEKYYDDTLGLMTAQSWEQEDISERLLGGMSTEEIDSYIMKLEATIKVLKQTPVPRQIANIHKLRIAQLSAGARMFEIARDEYRPDAEGDKFWQDYFYQVFAAQQAATLELLAWQELGLRLKDAGGLPEVKK